MLPMRHARRRFLPRERAELSREPAELERSPVFQNRSALQIGSADWRLSPS